MYEATAILKDGQTFHFQGTIQTCAAWADDLSLTGKPYSVSIVVITEEEKESEDGRTVRVN